MDTTDEKKRIEIFCCYAHEDQSFLVDLKKHLKLWERQGLLTLWTDTDITAGTNWENEIVRHLNTAHIILFLVSPDFLASEYCYSTEMRYAMERYDRGEVRIIPIILRHCAWQEAPFAKIQALPAHAEPVVGWHDQDEAFTDVVRGIRKVVEALTQSSQQKDVKDFLTEPQLTYETHPDQSQQTSSASGMLDRSKPAHQGISRRTVLVGLAGLATVAVAGSGMAIFLHERPSTQPQPSQNPTVGSLNPAINSLGAMFGFNPQHTRFNPDEHILSPTSVSRLVLYWTATTGSSIHSSPAVANGMVYVGSDKLYAFNATTGKTLWTASTGAGIGSSPAVASGVVYIGCDDHKLYAFNAITGEPLWTVSTGDRVGSSPTVTGGVVYVGSWDHSFYAFNAATGEPLWTASADPGYWIFSSPAVANGVVYVGSYDHKLYAFNAATGKRLWTASTGYWIFSSPAVANGMVYIGSDDHKLYAFNAATGKTLWTATHREGVIELLAGCCQRGGLRRLL